MLRPRKPGERGAAQVDDAEMKYVVVHLHRLEPGMDGISRPKDSPSA
jgi:hypothetical protein